MSDTENPLEANFVADSVAWKKLVEQTHGLGFQRPGNTIVQLSMPKSGTHLLRNLLIGFFSHEAYDNGPWFFSDPAFAVFTEPRLRLKPNTFKTMHAGCDEFHDATAWYEQPPHRSVLLVRDPAASLMSLARQVYNQHIDRADYRFMLQTMTFDEVLNAFARGYQTPYGNGGSLREALEFFAVSWIGRADMVVRFDDLAAYAGNPDSSEATRFFQDFADLAEFQLPEDWRGRVRRFSSGDLSATFASVNGGRAELEKRFGDMEQHAQALVRETCADLSEQLGYPRS